MTVTSHSAVDVDRPDRYAKQLCSHAGHRGAHASWRPPNCVIRFPSGAGCDVLATGGQLLITAAAPGPATLAMICARVGALLERVGSRDRLHLTWHQGEEIERG